jgi:hypothetical protein
MIKALTLLHLLLYGLSIMAHDSNQRLKAEIKNKKVKLLWAAASHESDINYYLIERSSGGREFQPVAFVKPSGESHYFWYDREFYSGTIYYRVKAVSHQRREVVVGTVIAFQILPGQKEISVYPDLKRSFTLYADISRLEDDQATVEVIDADGFVMTRCRPSDTGLTCCPVLTDGVIQKVNCMVTAVVSDKIIRMRLNIYDASLNVNSDTRPLVAAPLVK